MVHNQHDFFLSVQLRFVIYLIHLHFATVALSFLHAMCVSLAISTLVPCHCIVFVARLALVENIRGNGEQLQSHKLCFAS